ncbi:aldose 1-epimerase family protein [Zavarzinia sp.]|uniref:aldose 1-epimerase family protein n=1 Tax=Zavarzinia sp. TaxID=2027920 RepID=UPI003562ED60
MTDSALTIAAGPWRAAVKPFGAELCSLAHEGAGELIWPALDPWRRHAPNLFPIVGRLSGDRLLHRGVSYPMGQHGFARDLPFALVEQASDRATFRLTDGEATRRAYPFAFRLDISFALDSGGLSVTYEVANPGAEVLPASVGAHPAFRWPMDRSAPREAHAVRFDQEEPAPIRRLDQGLILPEPQPTPVVGRVLALDDELFLPDAMIFEAPVSRGLSFGTERMAIRFTWEGFGQFGIWTKPGAPYLCLEPWAGFASPRGFDGEFTKKPGIFEVMPGSSRVFSYRVSLA